MALGGSLRLTVPDTSAADTENLVLLTLPPAAPPRVSQESADDHGDHQRDHRLVSR